jgi:hypothetical protein
MRDERRGNFMGQIGEQICQPNADHGAIQPTHAWLVVLAFGSGRRRFHCCKDCLQKPPKRRARTGKRLSAVDKKRRLRITMALQPCVGTFPELAGLLLYLESRDDGWNPVPGLHTPSSCYRNAPQLTAKRLLLRCRGSCSPAAKPLR